jgi:riboflavin biosynthesis pyrimidine reductase
VASKLIGGRNAQSPVAGQGKDKLAMAVHLESPQTRNLDGDLYIFGRTRA